jgi:hypothetical protein
MVPGTPVLRGGALREGCTGARRRCMWCWWEGLEAQAPMGARPMWCWQVGVAWGGAPGRGRRGRAGARAEGGRMTARGRQTAAGHLCWGPAAGAAEAAERARAT